ncbi:ATP-binding protein [Nonomuraea antimicrobica]
MNPLDFLGRIKVKLGIVIVLAVGTAFVVNEVGINAGLSREVRIAVAVVLALIMVQVLAMGMTKPLRQMARAAQTIAKGSYTLRVNATSRDEVGELARAFNAMAADLGEVDRQRRELVANVSHELRTPITGLRAVLENVVDGVSAADPGTMRTALAQTERLGRLVAQLLDLSRLDSGVRLIEAEAVELAPLAEQAVREAALAREDVVLRPLVPGDLAVRADPDLLAQVLSNLLDNAVRHSPPGGVVTVRGEADGSGIRLTVDDQGPGIPSSARGRVFERFSRLDAGRAADSGGAGLGLAIVKEIVELHGGSIRIDDCAGCRMVVELPGRTTMTDVPLQAEHGTGDEGTAGEPADAPVAASTTGVTARTPAPMPTPTRPPAPVPSVTVAAAAAVGGAVTVEQPVGRTAQITPAAPAATSGAPTNALPVPASTAVAGAGPVGAGSAPGPLPVGSAPYGVPGASGGGGVWARLIGGGVIGVMIGFLVGMFAAVLASVTVGDGFALVTLVGCVALTGAVGAALGAGSGRRAAAAAYEATAPYRGQAGPPPPYVPPPLFPRPELPEPPRWLLPAAAGAGVFAAVALPEAQIGLGIVLVAMVLGAAALPAVRRRMTPWTLAFGATAYWLISMAAVRDADWLVAILLVAGAGLGGLAVSGAGAAGWA